MSQHWKIVNAKPLTTTQYAMEVTFKSIEDPHETMTVTLPADTWFKCAFGGRYELDNERRLNAQLLKRLNDANEKNLQLMLKKIRGTKVSSPETISLSEAVAIWLETGVWPNMQAPSICQGRDSWNKPGACSFEKIDKDGYKQSATFHKDQRFIKPVERKKHELV